MENTFELFPKIPKSFWRLPKIFQNFIKYFFYEKRSVLLRFWFAPWCACQLEEKINKLFTGLWSVRIGKNCDLGLNMLTSAQRPRSSYSDLGHSFSLYGPPSR